MTSVTTFLFGLILVHNIEGSKDGCPPIVQESSHFAETFGNTCFLFVDEEVYWNDARDKCWDMGGELLAVRDVATMNFIKATLNSKKLGWRNQGVWLGARYYSGKWRWTTGEAIDFQYWSPGQPSKILGLLSVEDCALMRRDDAWQWHDYICGSLKFHYKYICQFRLVKTTAAAAATTTTSSTAVTVAGIQGDGQSQKALYLKAFNSIYQHAAHSSAAAEDNGNMAILTIILIVGGIILLGLLIAFLVVRRRYQHALKHIDVRETVVHFANRSFTSAHTVLAPPPAPHVFSAATKTVCT
ncbi:lymphocyte antigen 75-like isoform X2 [Pomacea canaliculata]|uniref:lymphocyte antigen 75-like isoform X2 n=1 Tax=Pomacea canaliculata TaxID=400727 RepID=UPI000D73A436|nr:lymphocyte antigen 75-like isoform X2 [Pomacea canaliculata]